MIQSLSVSLPMGDANQAPQVSGESAVAVSGERIAELYRAFQKIRGLTQQLNNRSPAEPLPDHVAIDKITVAYRVNGEAHTATVRGVTFIGDIAPLLARETEQLIDDIRTECVNAQTAASTIEEACKRAQYASRAQTAGGPG